MDVINSEDGPMIGKLNWWIYALVIITIFSFVLVLNYIVKKINEARIEGRTTRLHSKASASQTAPVQSQSDPAPVKINTNDNPIPRVDSKNVKGISLVFNKEENLLEDKRRKEVVPDASNTISVDCNSDSSQDYVSSLSVSGKSAASYPQEESRPLYLGKIYAKHLKPKDSKIKIELSETKNIEVEPSSQMTRYRHQEVLTQYSNELIRNAYSCDRIGQSKELITIDQSVGASKASSLSKYETNYTTSPIKIDPHIQRDENDSIINEIVDSVLQEKKYRINLQAPDSTRVSRTRVRPGNIPSASKK